MKPRIHLSLSHMGGHELNYVSKAFEDNWITTVGPNVTGFEQDLQACIDERRARRPAPERQAERRAAGRSAHRPQRGCWGEGGWGCCGDRGAGTRRRVGRGAWA